MNPVIRHSPFNSEPRRIQVNLRHIFAAALLVSLAGSASALAQTQPGLKRITVASAVRVRSGPGTYSAVIDSLSIGVLLDEKGRSPQLDRIGDQQDYWYRVAIPGGREGWVFGGLTMAVDPAAVDDAYVRIASERLSRTDLGFNDLTDAVAFLSKAERSAASREARGRLAMSRLQMIQKAADSILYEQRTVAPYKAWISQQEASTIRLDEVQGALLVRDDLYRQIADEYADTKVGDELAWIAAEARLGGECEGDVSCNLGAFNRMHGRYLSSFPEGAHASKVVSDLVTYLEETVATVKREPGAFTGQADDAAYITEYRAMIAEAKASVKKTAASGRDRAIALLDELDALSRK